MCNQIPGALQNVLSAGAIYDSPKGIFGSLRLRYFGPRPLIEDDIVRSKPTTTVDLRLGWEIQKRWRVSLDVLNVLNDKDSDIDYYYPSRLPGESADGVNDIHLHPAEPFAMRFAVACEVLETSVRRGIAAPELLGPSSSANALSTGFLGLEKTSSTRFR